MKTVTLLAFLALAGFALAQSDSHEADRAALRELGRRYEAAINSWDLKPLSDAVQPDATAVFMTNDEAKGIDAMQKFVEGIKARLGPGTRYKVKLNPDTTDFYGDIAVAHGTCDETVVFVTGTIFRYVTKWTAVLTKTEGHWQAARLHVSLDPIENPIVAARIQWRGWLGAGVGALSGLAIGLFFGLRKRKAAV